MIRTGVSFFEVACQQGSEIPGYTISLDLPCTYRLKTIVTVDRSRVGWLETLDVDITGTHSNTSIPLLVVSLEKWTLLCTYRLKTIVTVDRSRVGWLETLDVDITGTHSNTSIPLLVVSLEKWTLLCTYRLKTIVNNLMQHSAFGGKVSGHNRQVGHPLEVDIRRGSTVVVFGRLAQSSASGSSKCLSTIQQVTPPNHNK